VRLAALMSQPVIFVFSHDSIFVGEDGPTHQPVEQIAALRAIPNLDVWRPADARETVVAWDAALRRNDGPTALLLSRQNLPVLEQDGVEEQAQHGGWVVAREAGAAPPELVFAATGSELPLALAAASALAADGRRVRVVSLPCLERFASQDAAYQESVLPAAVPRVLVEAGVSLGLGSWLRATDRFVGMTGFGASAPYQVLATEFGFSAENVSRVAREMLS
jgi:transketolase